MRIVLSNASASWGGVHVVTETLARGLAERGHQVTVFCRPESALEERLRGTVALEPVLRGMDLNPAALLRCARALRRHRPAVVLAMMEKDVRLTGPVARAMGIPVVIRRPNDRPLRRTPQYRILHGWLPIAHAVNSEATRRTLLASAPWLDPDTVHVIHNGIPPAPAEPGLARATLELPAEGLVIGFVGRFDARKGIFELAAAWPEVARAVPGAHLVIVGTGRDETEFRAALRQAPRVHWLGYRPDVAAILPVFDVLAMPSWWEGFGLVAGEALAAGVPVVAADASSLPEIVRPGVDGLLVPARDPAALARALIGLAGDPAARRRMGESGRDRIRTSFTVSAMVDRYEALLQQAAGAP